MKIKLKCDRSQPQTYLIACPQVMQETTNRGHPRIPFHHYTADVIRTEFPTFMVKTLATRSELSATPHSPAPLYLQAFRTSHTISQG